MRSPGRRRQRGAALLLLLPFILALLLGPMVAARKVQLAEQKRLDQEVRIMLAPKAKRAALAARPIAAEAELEAEVEANAIRF